jgi:hypothetical protein
VGFPEVGLDKDRIVEIGISHDRAAEIGPGEIGSAGEDIGQVRVHQSGVTEPRFAQIRTRQHDVGEVRAGEIDTGKPRPAEIGADEIEILSGVVLPPRGDGGGSFANDVQVCGLGQGASPGDTKEGSTVPRERYRNRRCPVGSFKLASR